MDTNLTALPAPAASPPRRAAAPPLPPTGAAPPVAVRGRAAAVASRRAAAVLGPPLLFLAASLLLRAIAFVPAVFDTDEGLYILQAREWLRGHWPLVAVWDMHPVGAPALIAVAFALLGESIATVRLLGAVCVAGTAWALFGLVRAAGGPRPAALGAGMLYIAYSLRLGGLATNTEVLFAPFVVLAMTVGLRASQRALVGEGLPPRRRDLVAMGLLMGCGFAIKPVVGPEGCLAFALLTFPALWRRLLPLRRFLPMAAGYAGLVLLPTLLFGLAYAVRGEVLPFLEGSFLAPFRYSLGRLPLPEAARLSLVAALILTWPIALSAFALARWAGRRGAGGRLARAGLLWFAVATAAIAGPGYFFQHYFLIWLPPLSVLAALGAWRLSRLARPVRARLAYLLVLGAAVVHSWLGAFVPRLDRGVGYALPDPVRQVAAAIAEELAPGETIYVANYHPVVYFLSGAEVPTRFVFPAHLTGGFARIAGTDANEEISRILGTLPRFIVVDRGWWWSVRPEAAARIEAALTDGYELAETVTEERGPVEVWRRR
jgi:4-amino-4-deoxy-L-arabinose transferase-like glycosyltransferase